MPHADSFKAGRLKTRGGVPIRGHRPPPKAIAALGRGGDSEIGHLTTGETVVPKSVAARLPGGRKALLTAFRRRGLDPGRYIVGGADDSINPVTRFREFSDTLGGSAGDFEGVDFDDGGNFDAGTGSLGGFGDLGGFGPSDVGDGGRDDERNFPVRSRSRSGSGGGSDNESAPLTGGLLTGSPSPTGGVVRPPRGKGPNPFAPVPYTKPDGSIGYYTPTGQIILGPGGGFDIAPDAPATAPAPVAAPASTPATSPAAQFEPADASVATQLDKFLASDSPLLEAARTRAKQASNRRGLLNSSIAVQAGEAAMLDVALPIASQQAAQIQQRNLQGRQIASSEGLAARGLGSRADLLTQELTSREAISQAGIAAQERISASGTAAFDREKATAAVAQFDRNYQAAFEAIAGNEDLPAATREAYLEHIAAIRDSNFNLVEQLYNIDLVWASPVA